MYSELEYDYLVIAEACKDDAKCSGWGSITELNRCYLYTGPVYRVSYPRAVSGTYNCLKGLCCPWYHYSAEKFSHYSVKLAIQPVRRNSVTIFLHIIIPTFDIPWDIAMSISGMYDMLMSFCAVPFLCAKPYVTGLCKN